MILMDCERQDMMGQNCLVDLYSYPCPLPKGWGPSVPLIFWDPHTYAKTVWPRATKFGIITRVWHSRGSATPPIPRVRAPMSQKFLGPATHTVWETTTKFCMMIELDVGKSFCMVDDVWWLAAYASRDERSPGLQYGLWTIDYGLWTYDDPWSVLLFTCLHIWISVFMICRC